MLRKRGWIFLACALIAGPLLFGLHAISAEVAWMIFLGFAALIVTSIVFGERGRRRPSLFPFHLRGDLSEDEAKDHGATPTRDGEAQPFTAGAGTPTK